MIHNALTASLKCGYSVEEGCEGEGEHRGECEGDRGGREGGRGKERERGGRKKRQGERGRSKRRERERKIENDQECERLHFIREEKAKDILGLSGVLGSLTIFFR